MCLRRYHAVDDGGDNPLTLEDAPPKALGGKPVVLTCKKCNNIAGSKIDVHLVERLREIDDRQFLPGTEVKVKIKVGDETFRATISVDEKGTPSVHHSEKNNHPKKLAEAMKQLTKGSVINPEFFSRVIPENLEYALLKTGYILAFQKLGYSLMLDPCFDVVRQQLQDPETPIYPTGFWLTYTVTLPEGIFISTAKGEECLVAIFVVDTGKTKHQFLVILPLPVRPLDEVIANINAKREATGQFALELYPYEQKIETYTTSLENIKLMRKWIADRAPGWKGEVSA